MPSVVDATFLPVAFFAVAFAAFQPIETPSSASPDPVSSPSAVLSPAPAIDWRHAPPPKGWYVEPARPSLGFGTENSFGLNTEAARPGEYERYSHSEPDGRLSIIVAQHTRCDDRCDPVAHASLLANVLHHSFRTVTTLEGPMCGAAAARVSAEGGPSIPGFTRNVELTFFHLGDEIVTFSYFYTAAAPRDNVDAALASLCPTTEN